MSRRADFTPMHRHPLSPRAQEQDRPARTVPFMPAGRGEVVSGHSSPRSMVAEEGHVGFDTPPERTGLSAQGPSPPEYSRQDTQHGSGSFASAQSELAARNNPYDIFEEPSWDFPGTTSRGGHVPPPPAPGYQNTATIEQQMMIQSNEIHHHIDSVVKQMTHAFDSGNNWTTDQIMRQADNMIDIAEHLQRQLAKQNETVAEMRQAIFDMRRQVVDTIQAEANKMEMRLRTSLNHDYNRLRDEMHADMKTFRCSVSQDLAIASSRSAARPSTPRIFSAPVSPSAEMNSRSPREALFNEPHPSSLRSVSFASHHTLRESSLPSIPERRESAGSAEAQRPELNGGASSGGGGKPGRFLRQIRSKASLGGLNKRAAEKKENMPPVPHVRARFVFNAV